MTSAAVRPGDYQSSCRDGPSSTSEDRLTPYWVLNDGLKLPHPWYNSQELTDTEIGAAVSFIANQKLTETLSLSIKI